MLTAEATFRPCKGEEFTRLIPLNDDGSYPGILQTWMTGNEWLLAHRPGISENLMEIRDDGSLEPALTLAIYYESTGVDATCLDCGTRNRFRSYATADGALRHCRHQQHSTLLLAAYLDDANVVHDLNPPRTVGEIRESTRLVRTPMHGVVDWLYARAQQFTRWRLHHRV